MPSSVRSHLKGSVLAVASLLALSACSQPSNTAKNPSTEPQSQDSPATSLPTEIPAPYSSLPRATTVSACNFDPVRSGPEGNVNLSGWAVINAATGEVPEAIILQIEKNGNSYYVPTKQADRKDIASRLNNPALIRSGFTSTILSGSIKPPFSATMLLVFQKKLLPCEYKAVVK